MRRIKKFVLVAGPLGLVACASVWGFEEAKDRPADGGVPSNNDGGDGGVPPPVGDIVASDVQGIVCAPKPPAGFQGPLALYTAATNPAPSPPPCLDQYDLVYDGNGDVSAPAGECKCECDPSTTTACESPLITRYSDDLCTKQCAAPEAVPTKKASTPQCGTMTAAGACVPDDVWAKVSAARPGGACTKKTVGPPPAPVWGTVARLCEPKKDLVARCDPDKALAPLTKLPYQTDNYCILSTNADAACPPTYPKKLVLNDPKQVSDTRDCAACTCTAPTGTCGGSVVTTDTAADCSGGVDDFNVLPYTACLKIEKSLGAGYTPGAGAINPKCDPGGGGPTGSFKATAPTTVCCRF